MSEDTTDLGSAPTVRLVSPRSEDPAIQERLDLAAVLATDAGRRFIMRIIGHAAPYLSTFHVEPTVMARSEGAREAGLWLIGVLDLHDPAAYPGLLMERARRAQEADAAKKRRAQQATQPAGIQDGNGILVDYPSDLRNV